VDRASMSVALESRAPMLDHRLVEFAWKLPGQVLVRDGVGKWILRQVLDRYVPRELVERPKVGFGIPIGQWLRSDLREWAEHLLAERELRRHGALDPEPVRRMWSEHLSGTHDRHVYLWGVLMLQAWLERQAAPNPRNHVLGASQERAFQPVFDAFFPGRLLGADCWMLRIPGTDMSTAQARSDDHPKMYAKARPVAPLAPNSHVTAQSTIPIVNWAPTTAHALSQA